MIKVFDQQILMSVCLSVCLLHGTFHLTLDLTETRSAARWYIRCFCLFNFCILPPGNALGRVQNFDSNILTDDDTTSESGKVFVGPTITAPSDPIEGI